MYDVARHATQALLDALANGTEAAATRHTEPMEFVVRDSTASR
ncbi:hypothetical protein ACFVW8_06715 [Streptomyces sp. NPDC058221]